MSHSEDDRENRTVFCGNLSQEVTEELLYELFYQAGPIESVRRPKENGRPKSFAFILYKDECSVPYAVELLRGEKLFNRALTINTRSAIRHVPVLGTGLPEIPFNTPIQKTFYPQGNYRPRNNYEDKWYHRTDLNRERQYSKKERDPNEPSSWAELNALKGKGSLLNKETSIPQTSSRYEEESSRKRHIPPSPMEEFNELLQMGQQMMLPGLINQLPGFHHGPPSMTPAYLNQFPSMSGRFNGGERNAPDRDRDRDRRYFHEERGSRRDHPYSDRRHSDHHNDHRRHDRGYSSSRSSHERNRKHRKNR